MLDINGDGQLTSEELSLGFSKIMNIPNPEQEAQEILKYVDVNNSGAIDYSEFVLACIKKESLLSKKILEKAFNLFDADGNGYITIDELKEIFSNSKFKQTDWNQIIEEIDKNGDKLISYTEFKQMLFS